MKPGLIGKSILLMFTVAALLGSNLVTAARMHTKHSGMMFAPGYLGIQPAIDADFYDDGAPSDAKVELGRNLFFDKILSGNLNDSCASCHHPMAWSGDGLSLPVGEGGRGLGITRDTGEGFDAIHERVPRNAPPVFNLGAREFKRMFYDGRVAEDLASTTGFMSPAGDQLPFGLENVLAVQAMFPVTSPAEMAGQEGENTQADAASLNILAGEGGVWDIIAKKLQAIPAYVEMFKEVYVDEIFSAEDITFVHAANAIAAFEAREWRFDDSPFDQFLKGDVSALNVEESHGMRLFYTRAGCGNCHSGVFQTDQEFHSIAMPQIGPGKGDNLPGYSDDHDDFGRERVTEDFYDRFNFRTPTLRNITLSAPYGHSGAYNSLEAMVLHHLDSVESLHHYDQGQAVLPATNSELDDLDFVVMNDQIRRDAIAESSELSQIFLRDWEFDALIAFLHALTDPRAIDLRRDVPATVPSGLPVWD